MNDITRIRELAKRVKEFSLSPEMEKRRRLWTDHNSFVKTRPLIYIRSIPMMEFPITKEMTCEEPWMRRLELELQTAKYRFSLREDTIVEPYVTIRATVDIDPQGIFGLPSELEEKTSEIVCARYKPSIIEEDDVKKLHVMPYRVDEEDTKIKRERMEEVLDGILDVAVDRQAPLCSMWNNDISNLLAKLRGLEQIMWDAYDRPEWLHSLLGWMRDRVLEHIDQTEAAGGFRLNNHQNQAMPYCHELEPPSSSDKSVATKELWGYAASQETTGFGPDLFEEFMFRYQKPILERYGLTAYGCCEDLTHKIDAITTLKNLRRFSISAFTDVRTVAEKLNDKYILSWRPNPASACSYNLDEDFVRSELRNAADIFDANNCIWDVTLKDLETTNGDETAIIRWTDIIRDELERRYGD
ncbi:MAG: hypothetical protein GX633_09660 [Clostridiales bacterium]|nr:hypothetical protein [Clostridiales bacterium]